MNPIALSPAMPSSGATDDGPHVKWIGSLSVGQDDCVRGHVLVAPQQAVDYRRARILLRHGLDPVHFVETDIVDGTIRVPVPSSLATDPSAPVAVPHTPVSVVLCTRERPADLAGALTSIVALDYRNFEVVVVDNAPTSDSTERVVNALGDPRVRRIVEPVPGLSSARNAGLQAARHEIVAFTDDDVVVDRNWLHCIARGFARHPDASCVCGLVPSGELRTAAQAYFDQRVSWSDSLDPRRYSLADPPADVPLFPFQVGRYGTGANFAVRRSAVIELGGFDEALGAGTPTRGGEDIDMFYRLIAAGHALATEPSAIVWHRHRSDSAALLAQAKGYGLGLGAWLTKVVLEREHRRRAVRVARRRLTATARTGAAYGSVVVVPEREFDGAVPTGIGITEVLFVLAGPWALWRGRRRGRRSSPLAPPPSADAK